MVDDEANVSWARNGGWLQHRVNAAGASPTAGSVMSPSTPEATRISGTRLKNCQPATRPGRAHCEAIAVIDNDDVLETGTASGATRFSSCWESAHFASRFSTMASTTRAQPDSRACERQGGTSRLHRSSIAVMTKRKVAELYTRTKPDPAASPQD